MNRPAWYSDDLAAYRGLADAREQIVPWRCMDERTAATPIDLWYFYQDTWAFRRVMEARPAWLLDVGSTALLVGILAQVLPVTSVDVRPLLVTLPGLTCTWGTITALPFPTGTVPMATSLSVIEHIGLGRYGDELDPCGSERACKELQRVLAPGGRLLLSVPVADDPVTLFNAHRLLSIAQVRAWLDGCALVDSMTIQGEGMTVWCGEFVKGGA
jgi:SAM-dependent methyltransferase